MAEKLGIEQIVEKVVAQVLDAHVPVLRDDLVREVLAQLQTQAEPQGQTESNSGGARQQYAANLVKAVAAIRSGSSQKEILAALLDATVHYSGRSALFVMKAGNATGWQGRAFANADDIKNFALDVSAGLAARVIDSRTPASGTMAGVDANFVAQFGAPNDDHVLFLPLVLKDKLAAIVYADPGADGRLDCEALELLVTSASAWLEVSSLRKQAQKEGDSVERQESATPVQAVSPAPDPFSSHVPVHSAPQESVATVEQAAHDEPPQAVMAAAAASSAAHVHSPQDDEIHRKAQRFARLLMDEIKLYNQAKVNEGRKHRDLYDRLKEDIEKSRATYKKRYGNTPAANGDYFNHELLRSLAEDDVALMGANFRQS